VQVTITGETAITQQLATIANKRGQPSHVSVPPMTIPLVGANGSPSALIVPENAANPGSLVGGLNAGTIINTPGKRLHG
jgi:hypothetical protein